MCARGCPCAAIRQTPSWVVAQGPRVRRTRRLCKRSRFAAIGLQATLRRMLVRGELETLRLLKSRNDAVLVLENALHRVLARGELETRRLLKSRNDAVLVLGNALHRSRLAQTDKRCVIQQKLLISKSCNLSMEKQSHLNHVFVSPSGPMWRGRDTLLSFVSDAARGKVDTWWITTI